MTLLRARALIALAATAAFIAPQTITPASAAPTVTAHSAGTKAVGIGTNAWGTASGAAGRQVWSEIRLPDGTWSRSQTVTAKADGSYVIPLTYGHNTVGRYTWRIAAATSSGVVRSNEFVLSRTGWVRNFSAGQKHVGIGTNAWGTAVGAAGRQVWSEIRLPDGTWSRSQTVTAKADGSYVVPLTYGHNSVGRHEWRIAASTALGTVRSRPFTLTRVGWVTADAADTKRTGVVANTWGTAHGAAGRRVWTEVKLPDGTWSQSQVTTASPTGGFVIPLTYGQSAAGTTTYRVAASTPLGTVRSSAFSITRQGFPLDLSMAAAWDKIAQCESSGNWSINTGNGYYGGLQFNYRTWHSVAGGDFAQYPHQATREEQITVANRLHAKRGFQPWSCARVL